MAKFTAYKVSNLPTSNIDENGLYFKKETGDNFYTSHLRASGDWIDLGIVDSVESINGLTGEVKIDLSFSGGDLEIIATGDGTAETVATITLINDSASGPNSTYSSQKINQLIGQAGGGDMLSSMYDPTGVEGDAFDYANMHSVPSFLEDAPNDGKQYARKDANWEEVEEFQGVETNDTPDIKLLGDGTTGDVLKAEITQAVKDDIADGVTAYGWGDHSSEGYQLVSNIRQDLSSPDATTYPSTQAVHDAIQNSGGGGGATSYAELVDAASVDLPTINTPLANALDLKQDKLTTDLSLYLDESTNELRVNTSETVQTFTWNSGAQEFTLVDEPVIIIGVFVDGIRIADWVNDLNIDVQGKKVTILKPLIGGSIINIHYKFITTGTGATTPYMTESQTDQKILDAFNLFSIYKDYDNISQLLSSQNLQEGNKVYQVLDASGDNNLSFDVGETRRQAFYRFKGSSNNNINDYYLVASPFGIGQGAGALQWGSTEW